MIYVTVCGVLMINIILKAILRVLSRFERAHNKAEEIISATTKMFVV